MELHVCSVSGGKDSTALYLWMIEEFGRNGFRAVFADTGSEAPITLNYVRNLPDLAGGPPIEMVKADFGKALANKGHTPSGVPFLDMLKTSGAPSPKRQFCTEKLKLAPIKAWLETVRGDADVYMYVGIRAAESERRSKMPVEEFSDFFDCFTRRPLLTWSKEQVFGIMNRYGVEPNPLYELGFQRVGCFPCIYTGKADLARMPEWAWERLADWEKKAQVSFFYPGKANLMDTELSSIKEWANTPVKASELSADIADVPTCVSTWGICLP